VFSHTQVHHRLVGSSADPALPPERRGREHDAFGGAHRCLQALALARKVSPDQRASPEVARKAREKFGWLLDGVTGTQ
jgi:hypothetical protein